MEKKILRIIMILMLVLMGSAQAMAQGDKLKKVSYAKSGETLKGEQLYSRNRAGYISEQADGYAIYPWIIYLENGGTVQLELPDGQKHQVGPGVHDFTYHNGEKMYIDVRVVSYAASSDDTNPCKSIYNLSSISINIGIDQVISSIDTNLNNKVLGILPLRDCDLFELVNRDSLGKIYL